MLNCSWEHSFERQERCQPRMGSIWGASWFTFSNEMAPNPCGWELHVPMECCSRSFCVSVCKCLLMCESCLAGDKLPSFSTYFLPTRSFPVVLVPFLPSRGSLGSPDLPSVHALSWMSYVELDLHILGCSMFFLCFWMRGGVDFVSLTVSCGFSSWSYSKRPFGTIRQQNCCGVWISSRQILIKHAAIQKSSLKAEEFSIWLCIQGRRFQAFKASYNFIFLQLLYHTGWVRPAAILLGNAN